MKPFELDLTQFYKNQCVVRLLRELDMDNMARARRTVVYPSHMVHKKCTAYKVRPVEGTVVHGQAISHVHAPCSSSSSNISPARSSWDSNNTRTAVGGVPVGFVRYPWG